MMRAKFNEQIETLNVELIRMGALCEDAIAAAIKALFKHDSEMVDKTVMLEREIDDKEREIERMCMVLLLRQQPVASDLRIVSSALKMISDMERIGDQALNIAEITSFIKSNSFNVGGHINEMSAASSKMVTDSIESFVKKDINLARNVILYDNTVDNLFTEVRKELVIEIQNNSESGEECFDLMMITKYLERIGDHAVNIAEWVIYSITGSHQISDELENKYDANDK